jgi:hypothetical protein
VADGRALIWRAFDAAERSVAPYVESAVRTDAFLDVMSVAIRTLTTARGVVEAPTRRIWHLANLPARSDVARLQRQVAALDRELRQLTRGIDAERADAAGSRS